MLIDGPQVRGSGTAKAVPRECSDFDALDRKTLQVRGGIGRIEHLAVEEGLLAARTRFRNVGRGNAEPLGGLAPEILAVDLVDQRLDVGGRLELAPADVLG